MKMLRLSKVLIHLKMKMRRLGKAKDVFIHLQPLPQPAEPVGTRRVASPKEASGSTILFRESLVEGYVLI
jgi:hypothetical protein